MWTTMVFFVCIMRPKCVGASTENIVEADKHWWVAIVILAALLLAFMQVQYPSTVPLGCRQVCSVKMDNGFRPTNRGLARVAQLARYRIAASQSHLNEVPHMLPPSGRYIGESREKDDLCFLNYDLSFDDNGIVRGTVRSQQKTFVVDGFYHAEKGRYIWGETDNSMRPDSEDGPLQMEQKLLSKRAYHTEAEVAVKDANTGHLFISFLTSSGQHGCFHCKYNPVGQLPLGTVL